MRFASLVCSVLLAPGAALADDVPTAVREAVASADRPEPDRARDGGRRPAEVLAFFGIRPGMTVLDVNSAGGYYTEIVSRLVGGAGRVIAHNDELYYGFVEKSLPERYGGDRLPNVETLHAANSELALAPDSVDAALMVLVFHDYWFVPQASPGREVDVGDVLARIHRALKPGAVLGIVDHAAPAGTGTASGNTTHRIDPAIVRARVTAAGFALEAESSVLRNPKDDLEQNVFAEGIRGKTDRFVYRFRKSLE